MSPSVSLEVPTFNEAPRIAVPFESIRKPDLRSVSSSNLRSETLIATVRPPADIGAKLNSPIYVRFNLVWEVA
jgi:hypothetical protein